MIFVVSSTKVSFDALYIVGTDKGMEKPVMTIPTGGIQVAMDYQDYDYDMAVDIAVHVDQKLEEGMCTDTDEFHIAANGERIAIVTYHESNGHTYYHLLAHEE